MPVKFYRIAHWLYLRGIPFLPNLIEIFNGLGTVINRQAIIGDCGVIGTGGTIGGRSGHPQVPVIGEGVMIGSGAKVLGPVKIGRFASIGANAVVLTDVPDFGVAVGIPAKVVKILSPDEIPDYFAFKSTRS